MVGVPPAILAKGPISTLLPDDDPDLLSLSSPATNLLKVSQTELETLSMLGLEIQEEFSSLGDCLSLLLRSSRDETRKV